MSDVLVDTSVWVDFLRGERRAVARVDGLLADDRVATSPIVTAEVTSGATSRAVFDELRRRLDALPVLRTTDALWRDVAEARFALARRGRRAHLVDLAIAVTAADTRHRLLTRDRDFEAIAQVVPVELELF